MLLRPPARDDKNCARSRSDGDFAQYGAKCCIILSHGGGTHPYIAGRAADLGMHMRILEASPGAFLETCQEFYFDMDLFGLKGGPCSGCSILLRRATFCATAIFVRPGPNGGKAGSRHGGNDGLTGYFSIRQYI
jgi:hypothetical protein